MNIFLFFCSNNVPQSLMVTTKYMGNKEDADAVKMTILVQSMKDKEIVLKPNEEIGSDVDANAGFPFLHQV